MYPPVSPLHLNRRALRQHLRQGGLIAYPTESCFGLGCDPRNRRAVMRLTRLKCRPRHKGFILLAAQQQQLRYYCLNLSPEQQMQLDNTWPGPHTWLLPASKHCPAWVKGRHRTVACRISAYPPAQQLCHISGFALISTSANRHGMKAARTVRECLRCCGTKVWIIRGKTDGRKKPSIIQDLCSLDFIRT